MKSFTSFLLPFLAAANSFSQSKKINPNKDAIIKSVERHQQELITISYKIWSYAEMALKEPKSAKELLDYTSNINS